MDKTEKLLLRYGWEIECHSPFEIRHADGSFATGQAAKTVLDECKRLYKEESPLVFEYKNWKGEVGIRKVLPLEVYFSSNEFHQETQWLMDAFDLDKMEERTFAMNDIIRFIKNEQ